MFGITNAFSKVASASPLKASRVLRTGRPQRLILMGTGPFAVPSFDALRQAGHEIALVVTRPAIVVKSRKGAPTSPVREFAAANGYDIFDPESINTPDAIAMLAAKRASLLIVCDYGQILSSDALATTPLGGINLHGSLLPAYRGAAPVQWAVLNGDAIAGVSVIHMTPRLDGGPVLATAEIPVDPADTSGSLESKLSMLGVEPTLSSVELLALWDLKSSIGTQQDKSKVSRAPRLNKASGHIDWTHSASEIDCHVRGMQPWPGSFADIHIGDDKPPIRISVRKVSVLDSQASPESPPGTLIGDRFLDVCTGPIESPGILRIDRLQPAGRNEISGDEFIRGYRLKSGIRFG